jgi:chemotaxis methyl-accepting protein methylase
LSRHDRNDYHDYETILIDIYVREKMFEAALKEVLARKNLNTLSRYYKPLAEKYPIDYFNAYRELLLAYADVRMGREHYREVASELKKMKTIRGFEKEFKEYIKMLKEKYAKRPAFIDEMKQL